MPDRPGGGAAALADGRAALRRGRQGPGRMSMRSWSPEKTWREECGVLAAVGVPRAAEVVGLGLHALQHRGQESSGLVSCDERGEFHSHKGIGLVSDVYDDALLASLGGSMAIGHNRYSTSGGLTL